MEALKAGLRYLMQTENDVTVALPCSERGALEAVLANLLEPDDVILVANNGASGTQVADTARRMGVEVRELKVPAGSGFYLQEIRAALQVFKPRLLYMTHAETSTGLLQNLNGIGHLCADMNCLLMVNGSGSVGGAPFLTDQWQVNAAVAGCQALPGAPANTSVVTLSPTAWQKIEERQIPVSSIYTDLRLVAKQWGCLRPQGSDAPLDGQLVPEGAALLAAVSQLGGETWRRQQEWAERLGAGLARLGLQPLIRDSAGRLPSVLTVRVPDTVNGLAVADYCCKIHNLDLSDGDLASADRLWRISLKGDQASADHVKTVLTALSEALVNVKQQ